MDFCQYNGGETAEQQQAETTANITDVTPKKAFTMENNIDYRKWNYKLRFQVKKMSDEVSLLKSKCRGLELELSENKFYTTKESLKMMSEQAKMISNYAQMYSDLLKENFELKRANATGTRRETQKI